MPSELPLYVLAADLRQAQAWADGADLRRIDWRHLTRAEQLLGRRGGTVVICRGVDLAEHDELLAVARSRDMTIRHL